MAFLGRVGGGWSRSIWSSSRAGLLMEEAAAAASVRREKHEGIHAGMEEDDGDEEEAGWEEPEEMVKWSNFRARGSILKILIQLFSSTVNRRCIGIVCPKFSNQRTAKLKLVRRNEECHRCNGTISHWPPCRPNPTVTL